MFIEDAQEAIQRTCRSFLTSAHLREICRHRGWSPPRSDKDALAAFVEARWLEPSGVEAALKDLEVTYLRILHLVAALPDAVSVRDLGPVIHPGLQSWSALDARADFNLLAEHLLSRGVVVIGEDAAARHSSESRYSRISLTVPAAHRRFLPPFPVKSRPLLKPRSGSVLELWREALGLALGTAEKPETPPARERLVDRLARLVQVKQGRLSIANVEAPGFEKLASLAREHWFIDGKAAAGRPRAREDLPGITCHILSQLPPGHGCTVEALAGGLQQILPQDKIDLPILEEFCQRGCAAGFLLSEGDATPAYAVAPAAVVSGSESIDPGETQTLSAAAIQDGLCLDLERTGVLLLLALSRVARARVERGRLCLSPDIPLMGRLRTKLESLPGLKEACALSPAFREARRCVEQRRGKVFLHTGLTVLRVDDLGLRTLLLHRFPKQLQTLGGPYLAAPQGLVKALEDLARREGFSPRRVA